jgi:hypothetical protein
MPRKPSPASRKRRARLAAIACRAATFEERLGGRRYRRVRASTRATEGEIRRTLGLAKGELTTALRPHGRPQRLLAEVTLQPGDDLPDWCLVLETLLSALDRDRGREAGPLLTRRPADSLGAALLPALHAFLARARDWLDGVLARRELAGLRADDGARSGLLSWLAGNWLGCSQLALYHDVRSDAERAESGGRPPLLPDAFARRERSADDWLEVFERYPVLARLFAEIFTTWQRDCRRFLERLGDDREALGIQGRPLTGVTALGDFRSQGLTAPLLAHFGEAGEADARTWVYKDRSGCLLELFDQIVRMDQIQIVQMDQIGGTVGEGAENRGDTGALAPLVRRRRLLVRGDYLWEDHVEWSPAPSESDVAAYFRRVGFALRLFQALGSTDLHALNLVAVGGYPAFIDLDTLLQPIVSAASSSLEGLLDERARRSPLGSGLLPSWLIGDVGRLAVNVGGLHHGGTFRWPYRALEIAAPGESAARIRDDYPERTLTPRVPVLEGRTAGIAAHVTDVVEGYRAAERAFHGSTLGEQLRALLGGRDGARVQALVRAGAAYERLMELSLLPSLLADARLRDTFLAVRLLAAPPLAASTRAQAAIVRSELATLRELKKPRFYATIDDTRLALPNGQLIDGALAGTALERTSLGSDSPRREALARDVDTIRSAIGLVYPAPPASDERDRWRGGAHELAPADLLDRAVRLADVIVGEAVTYGGAMRWLGAAWAVTAGVRRLGPLPLDLLSGNAGLAVVLAELHAATGETRLAEAARQALQPILEAMRRVAATPARPVTPPEVRGQAPEPWLLCGALVGWGSQLQAVRRCGLALSDDGLLELAQRQLSAFPVSRALASSPLDVLSGAAGLVLVASALWRRADRFSPVSKLARALRRARKEAHREPPYPQAGTLPAFLPPTRTQIDAALRRFGDPPETGSIPAAGGGAAGSQARGPADGGVEDGENTAGWEADGELPALATATAALWAGDRAGCEMVARRLGWLGAPPHAGEGDGAPHPDRGEPLDDALLDWLDLALSAHALTGRPAFRSQASCLAAQLVRRRSETGSWLPADAAADRHHLSAVTGLGAVAHGFLRLALPGRFRSLRFTD